MPEGAAGEPESTPVAGDEVAPEGAAGESESTPVVGDEVAPEGAWSRAKLALRALSSLLALAFLAAIWRPGLAAAA